MRLVVPETRVTPMILWFLMRVFGGMDFLLPLFHISLLEVATIWDPDGLPAAYPFGHRHYTGQGGDAVTRKKKEPRSRTNNMQSVKMRVQIVAEQHVSFQEVQRGKIDINVRNMRHLQIQKQRKESQIINV